MSAKKIAVILLSMGGPESTADIREYLYNIFSDRTLIRLPGGAVLQKPFARMISGLRHKKVAGHYNLIGGGSPLVKWTQAQAHHIERILRDIDIEVQCFLGMRYFRPTIPQAIKAATDAGSTHLIFLPMYPQYSIATTGSSFDVARKTLQRLNEVHTTFVKDFHDNPDYIKLMREYTSSHIGDDDFLMFSAHSLPQRFVDEGDPYVDQVKKTAHLSADGREYVLAFQSRTGPVEWVGPDTVDETKRLLAETDKNLFIVPISFVCDHIETLYEIDIELKQFVDEQDRDRIRRMPMFNDDSRFGEALARIVRKEVEEHVAN